MTDPKNPIQTIEFIDAILRSWKLQAEILADKKVTIGDFPSVFAAAPVLWKGFVGVDEIDNEMKVVDEDGRALIKAKIEEFVITPTNEELEMLVEGLIAMVLNMVEMAAKTAAYFKKKN